MSKLPTTVSVGAGPIRSATAHPEMLVMDEELYIHDMTPELARQWINTLTLIAEEDG